MFTMNFSYLNAGSFGCCRLQQNWKRYLTVTFRPFSLTCYFCFINNKNSVICLELRKIIVGSYLNINIGSSIKSSLFTLFIIVCGLFTTSHRVAPVCRNDTVKNWRTFGIISKTDGHREAAYVCWDGECSIRLPTSWEALYCPHYHQGQQYPRRSRDPTTIRQSCKIIFILT